MFPVRAGASSGVSVPMRAGTDFILRESSTFHTRPASDRNITKYLQNIYDQDLGLIHNQVKQFKKFILT